jgi:hypothetical protein
MISALLSLRAIVWLPMSVVILLGVSWLILPQLTSDEWVDVLSLYQRLERIGLWFFCLRMMAMGLFVGVCWIPLVHRMTRYHADYPASAHYWERQRWKVGLALVVLDGLVMENLLGRLIV